jgi:hypothetical protein
MFGRSLSGAFGWDVRRQELFGRGHVMVIDDCGVCDATGSDPGLILFPAHPGLTSGRDIGRVQQGLEFLLWAPRADFVASGG